MLESDIQVDPQYLLRFLNGSPVVLKKHGESDPQALSPRQEWFVRRGGFTWGYSSAGALNLAYALLGDCGRTEPNVHEEARRLIDNLLSRIDADSEHTLHRATILDAAL